MMIRRNLRMRAEKKTAFLKNAETPGNYKTEVPEEQQYTKTDINRMSKEDLVTLASEAGIASAEDKSGSELKKELIEKFGL